MGTYPSSRPSGYYLSDLCPTFPTDLLRNCMSGEAPLTSVPCSITSAQAERRGHNTGLRKELNWAHLGSHCPDDLSILPHSSSLPQLKGAMDKVNCWHMQPSSCLCAQCLINMGLHLWKNKAASTVQLSLSMTDPGNGIRVQSSVSPLGVK